MVVGGGFVFAQDMVLVKKQAADSIVVKTDSASGYLIPLSKDAVKEVVSYKAADSRGDKFWQLRIGIHTGPVTASASGRKKISAGIPCAEKP